jgi:hypothetical protein
MEKGVLQVRGIGLNWDQWTEPMGVNGLRLDRAYPRLSRVPTPNFAG